MNVRFWTWINQSPVKITLRPREFIEHTTGGPTDEGWSYERLSFEWDVDAAEVVMVQQSRGCDCDGPHYHESLQVARPQYLQANWNDEDEVSYPKWDCRSSRQRDHFAEAAGY